MKKSIIIIVSIALLVIMLGVIIDIKSKTESESGVSGENVIENHASEKYFILTTKIDNIINTEYGKNYGEKLKTGNQFIIRLQDLVDKNKKYKKYFSNKDYECDLNNSVIFIYKENNTIKRKYKMDCTDN